MKVSPVGPIPLGPSIALIPTPTTLNLERHRENFAWRATSFTPHSCIPGSARCVHPLRCLLSNQVPRIYLAGMPEDSRVARYDGGNALLSTKLRTRGFAMAIEPAIPTPVSMRYPDITAHKSGVCPQGGLLQHACHTSLVQRDNWHPSGGRRLQCVCDQLAQDALAAEHQRAAFVRGNSQRCDVTECSDFGDGSQDTQTL